MKRKYLFLCVKDLDLYLKQFSVENYLLTSPIKENRSQLWKYSEKEMNKMYRDIE